MHITLPSPCKKPYYLCLPLPQNGASRNPPVTRQAYAKLYFKCVVLQLTLKQTKRVVETIKLLKAL